MKKRILVLLLAIVLVSLMTITAAAQNPSENQGQTVKVTFIADGVTVAEYELPYGEALLTIPQVPAKQGYSSAAWDRTDFSSITSDIVVNAVYTSGSYAVLLPAENALYSVVAVEGGILVPHGQSYKFKVNVKEGYSKLPSFAVKVNGQVLECDALGVYTISSVESDCIVTVEGVADITAPVVKMTIEGHEFSGFSDTYEDFIYLNKASMINLSVIEQGAGIMRLQIAISNFQLTQDELSDYAYWLDYQDEMLITENASNFVYIKAMDNAGNVSYTSSAGILCDTKAPAVDFADGAVFYGAKTLKITDDYMQSVTVDGKLASPTLTLNPREEPYVINARDRAGNVTVRTIYVKKASPVYTVPTDLSAIFGQTLADVKLPSTENGMFVWSVPLSTSVGDVGMNKFYITFMPKNTIEYQTVTGIEVYIKVSYQAHNPPSGISVKNESIAGICDGVLLGVGEGMEYRHSSSDEWIKINSDSITGLAGGVYYVRRSASEGYEASPYVEVTIEKGRMLKVIFLADGKTVDEIEVEYGQPLVTIPSVPVKIGYNHATPYWDVKDFSHIISDMTVNAVYQTNTYTVTHTESDKFVFREGDVKSPVEYGKDYEFYIDITSDYMQGLYFAVRNNGVLIFPDNNGKYVIENVTEFHNIEVTGVVLNVSAEKNHITGIDPEKHYAIGDKLTLGAEGSGMLNTRPEYGDERYVPVSWSGYYPGRWDSPPYETSFTLYKEGEFTFTVVYRHEIYNQSGWVPYGEDEQTSITIQVNKLPKGVPSGNVLLSTIVCAVLIVVFTGVFIAWYIIKTKREKNNN